MKLSTLFGLLAASASSSFAAPTDAEVNGAVSMMAKGCTWTIENFSQCAYSSRPFDVVQAMC